MRSPGRKDYLWFFWSPIEYERGNAFSFFRFPCFVSLAVVLQVPRLMVDMEAYLGYAVSSEEVKSRCRQLPFCGACLGPGVRFIFPLKTFCFLRYFDEIVLPLWIQI